MTTKELQGIVRFEFGEGSDVEEFKRLSKECMAIVRNEAGTLQYDTFFDADETECLVLERFRDADALIEHGGNLAHLNDAIIATASRCYGELLGDLDPEMRARFDPDGPVQLLAPWLRLTEVRGGDRRRPIRPSPRRWPGGRRPRCR